MTSTKQRNYAVAILTLHLLLFFFHHCSFASAHPPAGDDVVGPVIGIDFGSSYTCVGVYKDGRVQIIANKLGHRTTPSYISFTDEGRVIGEPAREQAIRNSANTIFAFKSLLGRSMDEGEVQQVMQDLPYQIINRNNRPVVVVEAN